MAVGISHDEGCQWARHQAGDKAQDGPRPLVMLRIRPQGAPKQVGADQHDQYLAGMLQYRSAARTADGPQHDDKAGKNEDNGRAYMSDDENHACAKGAEEAPIAGVIGRKNGLAMARQQRMQHAKTERCSYQRQRTGSPVV